MKAKLDALGWYQIHPSHSAPKNFVADFEALIGSQLPEDYHAFLAHFPCDSGPYASVTSPIIEGPREGGDSGLMVCFGHNPESVSLTSINQDPEWAISGMILIGDDIFGNWFYLDLADGKVWFFDRDGSATTPGEGLALVGYSFSDFIVRMKIEPDGDIVPEPRKANLLERLRDWLA
ncbi:SMI1/KNR4 family protein [Pontixanthobacter aestiaquae]|uniref:Knr4/Smi1-like domain-containing protein n=1 Tax=Pontixanthobacter aestiaquae TaxID=1509367 RepID=A0A844Z405_9SPHN|nr:SMI1/KNR4 family protein [Pontixanthobacter aestiaquae]MDN3647198.1 SMI1/KNR4 family protein [Pontixanthobacter aestiaquae]MXO81827.1 hypothetical protein [Pontixanthobacter aestiaquae]